VITGAAGGIGAATAEAFSREGAKVVGVDLLEGAPGDLSLAVDVTEEFAVSQMYAQVREEFGRVDVLFNNAGALAPAAPLDEVSFEQWRSVVDTNLTGAFLMTRGAFRLMRAQDPRGGRIINNGSVSAHVPRPRMAAYTATKHAITGLTKATSLEGRAFDIACGQIDIGNAATDMAGPQIRGTLQADGTIATEPTLDLASVARAIVYMASLPLDANVQFLTVMATKMPYIGRG